MGKFDEQVAANRPVEEAEALKVYTPSKEIIDYIFGTEGLRNYWYQNPGDVPTIAKGVTYDLANRLGLLKKYGIDKYEDNIGPSSKGAQEGQKVYSQEIMDALSNDIIDYFAKDVMSIPGWQKMNQNQLDATLDYFYNSGSNHPEFKKAIAAQDWDRASGLMNAYNPNYKEQNLKRRAEERAIWSGVSPASVKGSDVSGYTPTVSEGTRALNTPMNRRSMVNTNVSAISEDDLLAALLVDGNSFAMGGPEDNEPRLGDNLKVQSKDASLINKAKAAYKRGDISDLVKLGVASASDILDGRRFDGDYRVRFREPDIMRPYIGGYNSGDNSLEMNVKPSEYGLTSGDVEEYKRQLVGVAAHEGAHYQLNDKGISLSTSENGEYTGSDTSHPFGAEFVRTVAPDHIYNNAEEFMADIVKARTTGLSENLQWLADRHGTSVGNAAHLVNYADSLGLTRRSYGGNLFDGNTQGSQQMDNDRSGISRFARRIADRTGKAARVKAMDIAYGIGGKGVRHINDGVRRNIWREVYPDVLQETYLFPSEEADRLIQKNGYTRLSENSDNYGLVEQKAREYLDKGLDLPYYEWHSNNNGVSRDDLESVGHNWILPGYYINTMKNYRKGWYGDPSEQLPHGGNHKSTIYYNESDGEFYQRAWDLNDYGGEGGGASSRYLKQLRKAASKLDEKGNPAVARTPFSRVQDNRLVDMLNENPEVLETVNGLGFIYPSVVTANMRAQGGPVDGVIDWSGIATTENRGYNADYLDYEYNKLKVVRQVLDRMNANSRKKGGYVNILGPGGGEQNIDWRRIMEDDPYYAYQYGQIEPAVITGAFTPKEKYLEKLDRRAAKADDILSKVGVALNGATVATLPLSSSGWGAAVPAILGVLAKGVNIANMGVDAYQAVRAAQNHDTAGAVINGLSAAIGPFELAKLKWIGGVPSTYAGRIAKASASNMVVPSAGVVLNEIDEHR